MRKSCAYEHESEIRAVFLAMNARTPQTAPPGYVVPIDFKQVVETVVVSPLAPPWFVVQIRKLCEDYENDVPVIRSGVYGPPVY